MEKQYIYSDLIMKTLDQILKPEYHDKILAHTSSSWDKNSETLIAHSQKTLKYCDCLINKLSLKENLNCILSPLVPAHQTPDFIELIRSIIYYHDLGKVNPVFQKEKMKNDLCVSTESLNSDHSFYGKILFDHLFFDDFYSKFCESKYQILFLLLSQTIDRHHTQLQDINFLYKKMRNNTTIEQELNDLDTISDLFFTGQKKILLTTKKWPNAYNFKNDGYKQKDIRYIFKKDEQKEALFYLYKTIYSLLITSDYYATLDFMQDVSYLDKISTINPSLAERCEKNFYQYEFDGYLLNDASCYKKIQNLNLPDINDLNELRTKILLESDSNLKKSISNSPQQRVFYLKVPTGGGKTNTSMKLALTLLKSNNNIKRIFYVFPFINLIEQNREVIKDTLGLNEQELSSVYSSSSWNIESNKTEGFQHVIDNEFLNHPFVVMSNVNFFNAFIKSGKTSNYRLVNLANSIVIIDEIQSLNDKDWTLFNDLIMFSSKYLNIYFIIMSATLPKLATLLDGSGILNLINSNYHNHGLFQNRVTITFRHDVNNLEQLQTVLNNEIHESMNKILLVVNTIKTSLELYAKVYSDKKIQGMGFQTYLLNSTILPHKRREIIKKMKNNDKIILISTQSVEAGVDIDCDFGIRDFALFDSIEQIAGRINRNAKSYQNTAKLIVTNLKENDKQIASFIYGESHRWQTISKDYLVSSTQVQSFLEKRDLDSYYNKVLKRIKDRDDDFIREGSSSFVRKGIRHLDFEDLNTINVINQNSISLFVDTNIPVNEFSKEEKEFIKYTNRDDNTVSGEYVWGKYNEFIENFKGGHIERKIDTKKWSSVLSKFMVSLDNTSQNLSNIIDSSKGIPLLKKEYYSDEQGIDREHLNSNSFQTPS